MPEWKQWHVLGNGEFPALQYLSIDDCPKLVGKFPENLCSLTKLRITRCPELFTSQLEGMKQIEELYISNCNSLTSMPISTLPSTLKTIWILHCRKLKLEAPDSSRMNSNMLLEHLRLDECDSISSSPELVPRARTLSVWKCQNLTRFFIPNGTETLYIWSCENLEILLSVECGTHMTLLDIFDCKKLKRLPEVLEINDCEKLVNSRKEWRLQRLPCLRELAIYHNGSDEEIVGGENWELPCSIRSLTIANLKTLSSRLLKSLTSIEYLWTCNLPQIQSLLEEGLPSSLSELYLYDHDELHALPTEGLRHLTSLQSLHINNCNQLQSLPESALPSSLSELNIWNCRNLQSLPVKGMTSSLSELSISCWPLLKPLLEFDKGEYWPEIAHISTIEIDDEYL
ncbi:putative disease resistance protein [Capsicum chacoense]